MVDDMRITRTGMPTTTVLLEEEKGTFMRRRMSAEDLELFLEPYEIIAMKDNGDGAVTIYIKKKPRCRNCKHWERIGAYSGMCYRDKYRNKRTGGDPDMVYLLFVRPDMEGCPYYESLVRKKK